MRIKTENSQKIYTYSWFVIPLASLSDKIKNHCLDKNGRCNAYINLEGVNWFIKKNLENLFHNIMLRTHFLSNSVSMSERIYCILNNIQTEKLCNCNKSLGFEFWSRGYREFCSAKCRANDKELQNKIRRNNIKKYGVDHISKLPTVKHQKSKTLIKNGYSTSDQTGFKRYRYIISLLTQQTINSHQLPNIEKRGRCGVKGAYNVDHIVSIISGYNNKIPPYIISSIYNLQCIPWEENIKKKTNNSKDIDKLLEEYHERVRQQCFRKWIAVF